MMKANVRYLVAMVLVAVASCCGAQGGTGYSANGMFGADEREAPKHEMRGAWLATVYGIDWPSRTGTTAAVADEQKRELREILDILQVSGINAVMFQVRSMCDAMYQSSYEPWSQWLTGSRGVAPAKGWDPLRFAVEEAHARGMELHAWVNPFRLANGQAPEAAPAATGKGSFNPSAKGWVIAYGVAEKVKTKVAAKRKKGKRPSKSAYTTKTRWTSVLDPGNPAAREHIVDVCKEIITKYDVDGLVFDDYFYPDRLPLGNGYDYDEWLSQCSGESGGEPSMSQADWRRENVNRTIFLVDSMIERERPWVRFGVSPAGVGGGNGAATAPFGIEPPPVGKDWMYDRIFCDPLRWLADGTVDYVSPQIYWACAHETNPYEPIAGWWQQVALHFNRHCYPSQKILSLPAGVQAWEEQLAQIEANRRESTGTDAGQIFYSTCHLSGKQASGLGAYLRQDPFRWPALMPVTPWKSARNPGMIKKIDMKGGYLQWKPLDGMRYVVYAVPKDVSMFDAVAGNGANFMARYIVGITYGHVFQLPPDKIKNHWYAVAPYDRFGNEWEASVIGL